jgi:hypothetical protein
LPSESPERLERGSFAGVEPEFFGNFETDPSLPVFTPERLDREMVYCGLSCPCGAQAFRLTGWPRSVTGRGGFFWRSVMRAWRESRLPMQDGELVASPFWIPIFVICHECGQEQAVFDGERVVGCMPESERSEPKESIRCRICHRGLFELVVGTNRDGGRGALQSEPVGSSCAVEIVSHCHSCHRQARIAWSDGQRSEQEVKLDLLYGRR